MSDSAIRPAGYFSRAFAASAFVFAALCAPASFASDDSQALIDSYIDHWAAFYPSEAYAYGDTRRAASFERFTGARIHEWLAFNREASTSANRLLAQADAGDAKVDLQVLVAQVENELAEWRENNPVHSQPQWIAEQISQALTSLLVREQLKPQARSDALRARLQGVALLAKDAQTSLSSGNAMRTETALRILDGVQGFYAGSLATLVSDWPAPSSKPGFRQVIADASASIEKLETHLREQVLPGADHAVGIGAEIYAAKLLRRTSGAYTPDLLRVAALNEVRESRGLMLALAKDWYSSLPADMTVASDVEKPAEQLALDAALEAMEAARNTQSAQFLARFSELTFAAEKFVEAHSIATVPKPTTLYVQLSPKHFSGAAVGGVYPSGPFDPNADTLFFVPSVPDTAPEATKEGFYRSFNDHFNTMIISHEMFPGHYLQYKVAVSQAPALRSLFPSGSYVEGWGTFVEELMLDAGWADDAALTRLAHLRKRLENATRAYVSVQVNTESWGEMEVLRFAREEGLLAPQFAENLWQRVVNSPMQITDYMTGYLEFKRLYANHLFMTSDAPRQTKFWVDQVLRAGPLPLPLLETILRGTLESLGH